MRSLTSWVLSGVTCRSDTSTNRDSWASGWEPSLRLPGLIPQLCPPSSRESGSHGSVLRRRLQFPVSDSRRLHAICLSTEFFSAGRLEIIFDLLLTSVRDLCVSVWIGLLAGNL
ncbi:hypothetical protein KC19_VG311400 [Ceratodon purpureus]|uniref:Uncharacterized protein n=1 Tax=Ceratodon purpureus TaxID=3225 RepID=A0A8T0HXA7_CERPU|nr:hypothetical protein KC19_VG311400 [Ceratodon purpureus]